MTIYYDTRKLVDECLTFFPQRETKKIIRKLKEYENKEQYDDFLIEVIIGCHLRKLGFDARYNLEVEGKEPDWIIYGEEQIINGVVEVKHIRIDKTTDEETKVRDKQKSQIITYWMDDKKDNSIRLIDKLNEKASCYKQLINKLEVPYLIVMYIDAKLEFYDDEIEALLNNKENGYFHKNKFVSGVYIIQEISKFQFDYRFWKNPFNEHLFIFPNQ